MKKLPNGFVAPALLLVVFILISVGAVFVYFQFYSKTSSLQPNTVSQKVTQSPRTPSSPVTDATSTWKTYESKTMGITISYPSNLSYIFENTEDSSQLATTFSDKPVSEATARDEILGVTKSIFLEDEYNSVSKHEINKPDFIANVRTTTRLPNKVLDGADALISQRIDTQGKSMSAFVSRQNNYFGIVLRNSDLDRFYQILSTVKFSE